VQYCCALFLPKYRTAHPSIAIASSGARVPERLMPTSKLYSSQRRMDSSSGSCIGYYVCDRQQPKKYASKTMIGSARGMEEEQQWRFTSTEKYWRRSKRTLRLESINPVNGCPARLISCDGMEHRG
jgi:hypothetical protein